MARAPTSPAARAADIRLGRFASQLYERPVLRASFKTSVYAEAKRRLMSSFAWAVEIVNAPDLDSLDRSYILSRASKLRSLLSNRDLLPA